MIALAYSAMSSSFLVPSETLSTMVRSFYSAIFRIQDVASRTLLR